MNILSVGSFRKKSNTSLHRHVALSNLASRISQVELYNDRLSLKYKILNRLFQKYSLPLYLPDENNTNQQIINYVNHNAFDLIWIDKGLTINAKTLKYIKLKLPSAILVNYSPDNMVEKHNQSYNYLKAFPIYDYHITTKSYVVEKLKNMGAKKVIFTNKSFNDSFHYPRVLNLDERNSFGNDIGFIGVWEQERCESILYLVNNGLKVTVYGGGKWNDYKGYDSNLTIKPGVFSEDYPKALQAFKISLCFLRKMNADLQTSRTMEIPACGAFMMAERTSEHVQLFEEGKEAEFFSSNEELLQKCKYYLNNEHERIQIAKAGYTRCINSGYSNFETLKNLISKIMKQEKLEKVK